MKIKKVLSAILAATMLLGSVTANAVTIESDDMPKASGASLESDDTPKRSGDPIEQKVSGEAIDKTMYGLPDNIEDGAILHAWCWSCATITANMENIAKAGYTAVQTSPMQQSYDRFKDLKLMGTHTVKDKNGNVIDGSGGAWWWQYQPTDQKLGNYQLFSDPGNEDKCKDEYKAMCDEAHKYGVKIITDVVTNHTTPHYKLKENFEDASLGLDISDNLINAVGGIGNLFHKGTPRDTSGNVISGAENTGIGFYNRDVFGSGYTRQHLINYMNGGLPDINTENHAYQAYVIEYLNTLIDLGCDGFRFDTAHRIGVTAADGTNYNYGESTTTYDYWDAVTGKTSVNGVQLGVVSGKNVSPDSLFIYGEMIKHDYDSAYSQYMRITDDTYGQKVRTAVDGKGSTPTAAVSSIKKESGGLSGYSVTWVESHDDYCNDHESAFLTDDDIKLSWAILTARSVGTPLFFNRPAGSNARSGNYWGSNTIGIMGNDQFRDDIVVAANKFRNAMVGENEYLRNFLNADETENTNVLQIDRGNKGSCIVNIGSTPVDLAGQETKLADGNYFDFVSKSIITVSNGKFTNGTVAVKSIAAIYCPIKMTASPNKSYFFEDSCDVTMSLSGVSTGTYTVTVDEETKMSGEFTDNQKITIGNDITLDDTVTSKDIVLTLKAEYDNVEYTQSFNYAKRNRKDITYVYYDPQAHTSWGDKIYAYIYGNGYENAAWPGVLLEEQDSTGYLRCEVPYELKDGHVIFNNNKKNGNVDIKWEPAATLEYKTKIHQSGGVWKEFTPPDEANMPRVTSGDAYVYFYNTYGWDKDNVSVHMWKDGTQIKNKTWPGESMTWSEDLHCFYYKYDASVGYNRVIFNDGKSSGASQTVNINGIFPGMIYAPTTKDSSGKAEGSWISQSDMVCEKIYFDNTANKWAGVNAKISSSDGKCNSSSGEQMTSCGGNIYCIAYYHPTSLRCDQIKFINPGVSSSGNLTLPEQKIVSNQSVPSIYNGSSWSYISESISTKNIPVTLKYYDRNAAKSGSSSAETFEENICEKTFTVQAANYNIDKVAADAAEQLKTSNSYDTIVFKSSQYQCVKETAATTDEDKLGKNVTYAARIAPEYFSCQTNAFSGTYTDYEAQLDKAIHNGTKWVTYLDSKGEEVTFEQVAPDLSNVSKIVVWGINQSKQYTVHFNYPTKSKDISEKKIDDTKLITVKESSGAKSSSCNYNQLVCDAEDEFITDMYIPSGYIFDGWYSVSFSGSDVNSYIKIASDLNYSYRVTSKLDLYAVFRPENENVGNCGAAAMMNNVDKFTEKENNEYVDKYRFNTVLNIYNCEQSDPAIEKVGVFYVTLGSGESYNFKDIHDGIQTKLNADQPLDCLSYTYDVSHYGDNKPAVLTEKNRIIFTFVVKEESVISGSYGNVLAFTAFKYNGDWYVSDNCINYVQGEPSSVQP